MIIDGLQANKSDVSFQEVQPTASTNQWKIYGILILESGARSMPNREKGPSRWEPKATKGHQKDLQQKHANPTWLIKLTRKHPRPESNIRFNATGAPKVATCTPGHHVGDFGERPCLICYGPHGDFWHRA